MLGEVSDADSAHAEDAAGKRLELPCEQLGEGRLAVAVGAEERDAVVLIDAQVYAGEDRLRGIVAGRCTLEAQKRARELLFRAREDEGRDAVLDLIGNRLHAGQRLDAALGLLGLAGLGLEAVDEGLEVAALLVLLLLKLELETLL